MDVVLCDDHRIFAEALAVLLNEECRVVACVDSPRDAVEVAKSQPVDLCIMDLQFPDACGFDGISALRASSPDTKVVVLSALGDDDESARQAIAAGAVGVASKSDGVAPILRLIEGVRTDTLPAAAPARVTTSRRSGAIDDTRRGHPIGRFLTAREYDVLECLAMGDNTKTVANRLGMRHSTARSHIQTILCKLSVHSKLEAVSYAVREGLVRIPPAPYVPTSVAS